MTDVPEGGLEDRCPVCLAPARQMFPAGDFWALWCRNQHRWLVPGLVQVLRSLLMLLLVWGAFWAGRMVEQRSQLGRMLVLAPALEDLEAATRAADSVTMRFLIGTARQARSISDTRRLR